MDRDGQFDEDILVSEVGFLKARISVNLSIQKDSQGWEPRTFR